MPFRLVMLLALLPLLVGIVPTTSLIAGDIDESQAVREIERLGGKLTRNEKLPGRPVTQVDFETNSEFSDQDLRLLKSFVELTTLELSNTKVCGTHIKGAGLIELRGLKKLASLSLWSSQISDAGLVQLQDFKSLTTLILAKTEITDAGGYGPCMAEVYAAFCRVSWDMWTRAWIGWVLRGVRVRA